MLTMLRVWLRAAGLRWRLGLSVAAVSVAGFSVAAAACTDKSAPEYIADQFVDAYFRRMDQQSARQFTALGATEMLEREIELTRSVRAQGYSSAEAAAGVVYRRTGRSMRGDRVRFEYDITIKHDQSEEHRSADVELANIQTSWKVVRVDIKPAK
jgi:hypothetical protein